MSYKKYSATETEDPERDPETPPGEEDNSEGEEDEEEVEDELEAEEGEDEDTSKESPNTPKASQVTIPQVEGEAGTNKAEPEPPKPEEAVVAEDGKWVKWLKELQVHVFCLDLCLPPIPGSSDKIKRPSFALMDAIFIIFNLCIMAIGMFFVAISCMILGNRSVGKAIMFFDTTGRLSNLKFGTVLDPAAAVMIPLGLILIFMGCAGCVGAVLYHRRLLMIYRSMMVGLIVGELLAILYTIAAHGAIGGSLQESMLTHIRDSYEGTVNSTRFVSQVMDVAQVYFGCCGVLGWKDFQNSPWYRSTNNATDRIRNDNNATGNPNKTPSPPPSVKTVQVPLTCCKADMQISDLQNPDNLLLSNPNCQTDPPGLKNPYTGRTCSQALKDWLWKQVIVFSSVAITILSMEGSLVGNAHGMVTMFEKLVAKKKKEEEKAAAEAAEAAEAELTEGASAASDRQPGEPPRKTQSDKNPKESNVDNGRIKSNSDPILDLSEVV